MEGSGVDSQGIFIWLTACPNAAEHDAVLIPSRDSMLPKRAVSREPMEGFYLRMLCRGKETNEDSPSSGERNGKSPALNPAAPAGRREM